MCVVVDYLSVALPLTPEKTRNVFENCRYLSNLYSDLNIPYNKRENVVSAAEYFMQSTEPMKVRKMIFYLEWYEDTALANTVMECAEPPAGIYMYKLLW